MATATPNCSDAPAQPSAPPAEKPAPTPQTPHIPSPFEPAPATAPQPAPCRDPNHDYGTCRLPDSYRS